jgi:transcriptional regulator of acetoin/glycerol metabolism
MTLAETIKVAVLEAMKLHDNNVSAAANHLGISRFTLTRRLRSYGLGTREKRYVASTEGRSS